MHRLHAHKFFRGFGLLATMQQMCISSPGGCSLPINGVAEIIGVVEGLIDDLTSLGMTGRAAAVSRGLDALKAAPIVQTPLGPKRWLDDDKVGRVRISFEQATSGIVDDLATEIVLAVDSSYVRFYEDPMCFGKEVFDSFPTANEDIEEAGKCLALGRATASVFHVMRALEIAAQVVASKIGATVTDGAGRGLPWGVIASNMKPLIDAMPKGSEEQIKWYRVQQNLEAVNRAWRVPTNHPKQTYTMEQANEIFEASKSFMRELAPLV
jgi:hypothetical protein